MSRDAATEKVSVVLAGGMGTRFGSDSPKQLVRLAGQPVLQHTLSRLAACAEFDRFSIAANTQWHDEIASICRRSLDGVPFEIHAGGDDRNSSIRNAITGLSLPEARILVHDGVRPLVSKDLVVAVTVGLLSHRSVLPAIPSADLLAVQQSSYATGFLNRDDVLLGQSPQGFWLTDLREAFRHADATRAPTVSTLFELVKQWQPDFEIRIIEGDFNNLKLTVPVDYLIAGRLLLEDD